VQELVTWDKKTKDLTKQLKDITAQKKQLELQLSNLKLELTEKTKILERFNLFPFFSLK